MKVKDGSYIVNSDQGNYRRNTIHIINPNSITYDPAPQETSTDLITNGIREQPEKSIVPDMITHQQNKPVTWNDQAVSPGDTIGHHNNQQMQRERRQTKLPRRYADYEIY